MKEYWRTAIGFATIGIGAAVFVAMLDKPTGAVELARTIFGGYTSLVGTIAGRHVERA